MNGALVGFRIGGEKKLLRLYGERSCEAVLHELHDFLSTISDPDLKAYAARLEMIGPADGPGPSEAQRQRVQACLERAGTQSPALSSWADVFASLPGLRAWKAGLGFMPVAAIQFCADVHWGFLLDIDQGQLQIFDNRNARFRWSAMGDSERAFCTVALTQVRQLSVPDIQALQGLLQQHVVCDGQDPRLPMRDGTSARFAGPGGWQAWVCVQGGHLGLHLERDEREVQFSRVGELRLDDPGCGDFLCRSLDAQVLALTRSIYGPGASLTQVARVAAHLPALPFEPGQSGLPLLDLGLRSACGLQLKLGPDFFDAVRSLFVGQGMTLQGWRFLIRQDNDVLRQILKFFPPSARIMVGFTAFINLMARALQNQVVDLQRCQAALTGVERILDRTRGRPEPTREANACIFLRAIMRASLSHGEVVNLDHEAQDISDYVYTHPAVLKGVTWRSLRRRSEAWHRALLITVDPATDVRWPALMPRQQMGEFVALELDCGYLLAEDGLEQRHCIGTYVNACSSGASRVFSLRRQGKRVATLELQRSQQGDWRLVQIRGKANTPITDAAILQTAQAVAQAYTDRSQAHERAHRPSSHAALQPGAYLHPAYVVHRQDHWTG